jgi:hypothetical protein
MKIKTVDGSIVDTNVLADEKAHMIELVEGSELRQWAHEHNGACFVWASMLGGAKEGWVTFYLKDDISMTKFLACVNDMVLNRSGGKLKLSLVPVES